MAESTIAHRQRELFALYAAITRPAAARAQAQPSAPPVALSDDDAELLTIGRARLGPVFNRLIDGNRSDYDDLSDADRGIIKDVLRLTGGDADRTERILRSLPLHRDKWDSRRGDKTWLRYSIDRTKDDGFDPFEPSTWAEHRTATPTANGNGLGEPKGGDGQDLISILQAKIERLQRERDDAVAMLTAQTRILRNGALTPAKRIATVGALVELWHGQGHAPDEHHPIYREAVTDNWHVGKDIAGWGIAFLAEAGAIDKQTKYELATVDRKTGEIYDQPKPRLTTSARPLAGRPETWAIVARAADTLPKPVKPIPPRCPRHPNAGTNVRHFCRSCHLPIDEVPTLAPGADVGAQEHPPLYTKKSSIGQLQLKAWLTLYQADLSSIGRNGHANGRARDAGPPVERVMVATLSTCAHCKAGAVPPDRIYYCSAQCEAEDLRL